MDRYTIFVDAGYFFAAGAQAAFGDHIPRKQVALKAPAAMLDDLCKKASLAVGGLPLLRAYWYDAMPGPRLSLEQSTLAMLAGIKLRLGALNSAGEQKGVDSLIVTDLIDLARNRATADAVVVTGDEDLRIAVQVAQSFGVRVHILAAGDPSKNVSPTLQMEADSVTTLDGAWFAKHLDLLSPTHKPAAAAGPVDSTTMAPASTAGAETIGEIDTAAIAIIESLLTSIEQKQLEQLTLHFSTQKTVPPEYDRPLVARTSDALSGQRLTGAQMRRIRGLFVRAVQGRSQD
ncbi:NYN domain-containing protein [Castellaniella sp.]|uniref:NYN domain-containing protein n=1 Tax=Castellaniella sp. TaxID=1955812 RepID=UPI002AFF100F|nr:NYN domain-containing protein [Castellaniella sp.]